MAVEGSKPVYYSEKQEQERRPLTVSEEAALEWAAKGKGNKEIAAEEQVEVRTVEKHFEAIFDKLGVHSRTAAVALYHRRREKIKDEIIAGLREENARLRRRLARMKRAT